MGHTIKKIIQILAGIITLLCLPVFRAHPITPAQENALKQLKEAGVTSRRQLVRLSPKALRDLSIRSNIRLTDLIRLKKMAVRVVIPPNFPQCPTAEDVDWNYYAPTYGPSEAPVDLAQDVPPQLPWIAQENNGVNVIDERWYPDPARGWVLLAYNLGRTQAASREEYGYVMAYNVVSGLARFFLWTHQPNQFFSKVAVSFQLVDLSDGMIEQPVFDEGRIFPNNSSFPDHWTHTTAIFTQVETNSWSRVEFPFLYDESMYEQNIPLGLRITLQGIDEAETVLELAGITEGDIQGEMTHTEEPPAPNLLKVGAAGVKALATRKPQDIGAFLAEAGSALYSQYFGEPTVETYALQAALQGTFHGEATGQTITIYPQTGFWFLLPKTFDPDVLDTAFLAPTELPRCSTYLGAFGFRHGNPRVALHAVLPSPEEPDLEEGPNGKPVRVAVDPNLPECDAVREITYLRIPEIIASPDAPIVLGSGLESQVGVSFLDESELLVDPEPIEPDNENLFDEPSLFATARYDFEVHPAFSCPDCHVIQRITAMGSAFVDNEVCQQ